MLRKALFAAVLLFAARPAHATDVYVSQSGGSTGSSCANAQTYSPNLSASPGDTIHLCGIFTGTAGQRLITVVSSGTATAPITIKFEVGAILSAPYWSQYGAINIAGRSFVVIDGGKVGVIQNSANGTGLKYQQPSNGVFAYQCNGCVIKNLAILNLYVRTSNSDLALNSASSVPCIYFAYATNFTIDRVLCKHAGWAFAGGGNNTTIMNSEAANVDHGVAAGASGPFAGLSIHDNFIHDSWNWDSPNDAYHHDGVHVWAIGTWGTGGPANTWSGLKIYNNVFDGDPGACCTTAYIFVQGQVSGAVVAHNRIHVRLGRVMPPMEFFVGNNQLPAVGNTVDHNVIVLDSQTSTFKLEGVGVMVRGQTKFNMTNNVVFGAMWNVGFSDGSTVGTVDNNTYEDLQADFGSLNAFGFNGKSYRTLASWQAACACDQHSVIISLK